MEKDEIFLIKVQSLKQDGYVSMEQDVIHGTGCNTRNRMLTKKTLKRHFKTALVKNDENGGQTLKK